MKWIDITKEAPSEGGCLYLVTDGEDVEVMAYFGTYKGAHDWGSYNCNTIDVTHWIPLPAIPPNTSFPLGRYVVMSKEQLKEQFPDKADCKETMIRVTEWKGIGNVLE